MAKEVGRTNFTSQTSAKRGISFLDVIRRVFNHGARSSLRIQRTRDKCVKQSTSRAAIPRQGLMGSSRHQDRGHTKGRNEHVRSHQGRDATFHGSCWPVSSPPGPVSPLGITASPSGASSFEFLLLAVPRLAPGQSCTRRSARTGLPTSKTAAAWHTFGKKAEPIFAQMAADAPNTQDQDPP